MTCFPLIFGVFLSIFEVFSKSNILTMIKPKMIIGPVLDRGLLGLSKNLKTFDLNRKLREEMRRWVWKNTKYQNNGDLDNFRATNSCTSHVSN